MIPKNLIFDSNFFIALDNVNQSKYIPKIPEIVRSREIECYVTKGVLEELHRIEKLIKLKYQVKKVDRNSSLYKEVREKAVRNRLIKPESVVDPEVISLAIELHKEKGSVGIVTNDEGIKNMIENLADYIEHIEPTTFLVFLYGEIDDIEFKNAIKEVNQYFVNYRIRRGREIDYIVNQIIDGALSAIDEMKASTTIERVEIPESIIESINTAEKCKEDPLRLEAKCEEILEQIHDFKEERVTNYAITYLIDYRLSNLKNHMEKGDILGALTNLEACHNLVAIKGGDREFFDNLNLLKGFLNLIIGKYENAIQLFKYIRTPSPFLRVGALISGIILNEPIEGIKKEEIEELDRWADDFWFLGNQELSLAIHETIFKVCGDESKEKLARKLLNRYRVIKKEIPEHTLHEIQEILGDIRDRTFDKIDEKILCKVPTPVSEVNDVFLQEMEVSKTLDMGAFKMAIVWNEPLSSRIGIKIPADIDISNAFSLRLKAGTVKKIWRASITDKKQFGVRGIIELSDDTLLDIRYKRFLLGQMGF